MYELGLLCLHYSCEVFREILQNLTHWQESSYCHMYWEKGLFKREKHIGVWSACEFGGGVDWSHSNGRCILRLLSDTRYSHLNSWKTEIRHHINYVNTPGYLFTALLYGIWNALEKRSYLQFTNVKRVVFLENGGNLKYSFLRMANSRIRRNCRATSLDCRLASRKDGTGFYLWRQSIPYVSHINCSWERRHRRRPDILSTGLNGTSRRHCNWDPRGRHPNYKTPRRMWRLYSNISSHKEIFPRQL